MGRVAQEGAGGSSQRQPVAAPPATKENPVNGRTSDSLVLSTGRFNPVHSGHVTMLNKLQSVTDANRADAKEVTPMG
jgi:hypothetical protein